MCSSRKYLSALSFKSQAIVLFLDAKSVPVCLKSKSVKSFYAVRIILTNHYKTVINIIVMDTTILQIPMPKSLKKSAQDVANDYGFSSLQDLLRVILTK